MTTSPSSMDARAALDIAQSEQDVEQPSLTATADGDDAMESKNTVTDTERDGPSRDPEIGLVTSTDNMEMVAGEVADVGTVSTMSKNAMKRAKRAERLAAVKLERRAREREAKKEKKRQRAQKRAAGELDDDDEEERKQRSAKRPKLDFGGTVVVDLGFDDLMSDKEVTSLCSQLAYTYSCNRRASYPFSLIYTSLGGKTHQRLETLGEASYKRWSHTKWVTEGYESLWQIQGDAPDLSVPGPSIVEPGSPLRTETVPTNTLLASVTLPSTTATPSGQDPSHLLSKSSFVYLTADTEDELTELLPNETYIIGGICDHNRYKNLCLNKARESGIRTARLPIGRYLASLPTRKVLTVNQVFEILVKWVETRDWEEALYSVMPKRKFQQGGKTDADQVVDAAEVEDEVGEDVAPLEQ